MNHSLKTVLFGDIEKESVIVTDQVLTLWTVFMFALGMLTGFLGMWLLI
jgi:hypothetical protein